MADGTRKEGITDENGKTDNFNCDKEQEIEVRLLHQSIDMVEGGVNE